MMLVVLMGLLTGAAFGVVLYKVGATRYSRIMGMLTLRDTKVMKFTFMTIATASMLYGLAALTGVAETWNLVPRIMPFLGWAHLLGGALFGAALGFVGTCPGTCMAKTGGGAGDKKFVAPASVLGLFVGIMAYASLKTPLADTGIVAPIQAPLTLHGLLGIPYGAMALIWGALFLVIAFTVDRLTREKTYEPSRARTSLSDMVRGEWTWVASGAVAGILIVLATAQNGYLGFSGALLAFVGWLSHLVGQPLELVPTINADIAWRAAMVPGVILGGFFAKAFSLPSHSAVTEPAPAVLDPKAIVGGFLGGVALSLGAMIGGGCTTGAYLAAWPTLSVGSLAMGGTFFAVSMAVSNIRLLTKNLDLEAAQKIGDRAYN